LEDTDSDSDFDSDGNRYYAGRDIVHGLRATRNLNRNLLVPLRPQSPSNEVADFVFPMWDTYQVLSFSLQQTYFSGFLRGSGRQLHGMERL